MREDWQRYGYASYEAFIEAKAGASPPDEFQIGQVWRHHTVEPEFVVTCLRRDGRVTMTVAGYGNERHLWPDYIRANMTRDWSHIPPLGARCN